MALCMVAFAIVGCGDDESWSPSARANDDSSEETSSSSEKAKSSSSDTQSEVKQSSSSEKTGKSSSSTDDASSSSVKSESSENSSSSKVPEPAEGLSSSDKTSVSSSSSAVKVDCAALLEGETGWSWDVPKECRFNPDIDYGTMTDERDGKVYRTVKIGDQVWMAENLNFDPGQGGSGEDKYDWSWCYDNEPKNCDVVGRYYTWAAAIDSVKLANDVDNPQDCGYGTECGFTGSVQGICPNGWHLPSEEEWWSLVVAVDADITEFSNTNTAGKALKSQSGWRSLGNGTDAFGFSALPTGVRYYNGTFKHQGDYAYFWSSSGPASYAYYMYLRYDCKFAGMNYNFKYYAKSVRCLKD